jgi:hypothetical protein
VATGKKPSELFDGDGLFLDVQTSGIAWWRWKYRFEGVEKLMSFRAYADVPLKMARDLHHEARKLPKKSIDPMTVRKAARIAQDTSAQGVILTWLEKKSKEVGADAFKRTTGRFKTWLLPYIGKRPIADIESAPHGA